MRDQLSPAGAAFLARILAAARVALVRDGDGLATVAPVFSIYEQKPHQSQSPSAGPAAGNQSDHAPARTRAR